MKRSTSPFLVALVLPLFFLLPSCSSEDDSTTLLHIISEENYWGYHWVVAHDVNGKNLAYAKVASGQELYLKTNLPVTGKQINVTIISAFIHWEADTYLNVELGRTIELKWPQDGGWVYTDEQFSVTISGCPDPASYTGFLADASGRISRYNNSDSTAMVSGDQFTVTSKIFYKANKFHFQLSDPEGNIRYAFLSDVKPNDHFGLRFDELPEMDHIVEFNTPATTHIEVSIKGYEPGQSLLYDGYPIASKTYQGEQKTQWSVAYPGTYSNLFTTLKLESGGIQYEYNHRGSVPSGIVTWPSASDFSVESKSIQNFSCSAPSTMRYRTSKWGKYGNYAEWRVHGFDKTQSVFDLPYKILKDNPALEREGFNYKSTSFYVGDLTYADFLSRRFDREYFGTGSEVSITIPD